MTPVTFKDKLLNYGVPPPMGAWEAVFAELTQSKELEPLAKKLFDFELAPPLHAWEGIRSFIEGKKEIPLKAKSGIIYKIMAAATILAVIIAGSLYLSQTNILKNKLSTTSSSVPDNKKTRSQEPLSESPSFAYKTGSPEITIASDGVATRARKNYKESNKSLQNTKIQDPLFVGNELGIMIAAKPIRNAKGEIIQDMEMMNNMGKKYISITGPNGQQTKISSKFLHMLLFINDDNDIDQVDSYFDKTFLESLIWRTKFQDWRNKILKTSLVPSSANFMDILEFKDLISQ